MESSRPYNFMRSVEPFVIVDEPENYRDEILSDELSDTDSDSDADRFSNLNIYYL